MKAVLQGYTPILQAGKFRHRIAIVKPKATQDSMGGWNANSSDVVCTCWATIEALSGVEKFAAHEFSSNVSHSIFIRYPRDLVSNGIHSNMQVWFQTRQFQIEAVLNPDERNKVLQLLCVEIDDSFNQIPSSPPLEGSA